MITKEQLQPFCSTDDTRVALQQPWTNDGYTYATDGRIIARVPAIAEIPDNEKAPRNIEKNLWFQFVPNSKWIPAPSDLPEDEEKTCEDCGGDGRCKHCGSPDECPACGGDGVIATCVAVTVGNRRLHAALLRNISALPGALIASDGEKLSAMSFKFDGGEGLLMPMRQE